MGGTAVISKMVAEDRLASIREEKWIVGTKKRPPKWMEELDLSFTELAIRYVLVIEFPDRAEEVRLLEWEGHSDTTDPVRMYLACFYLMYKGDAIVGPMLRNVGWSSRDKTG
jgi:hypothetical protein